MRHIEQALKETRGALCRDEAHVVFVAPETAAQDLPALVLGSLDTPLRTEILRLAGRDVRSAGACLLSALRLPAGGKPEPRMRVELEKLARTGSGLVLLLPEALLIEKTILRRLGRLAAATPRALRLVLFVDPEQPGEADPVAALVEALGVGAEKDLLESSIHN